MSQTWRPMVSVLDPVPLPACAERDLSGGMETLLAGTIAPSAWE